ncbi:MAG: sugar transferase [Pseudomonadota bacterium]
MRHSNEQCSSSVGLSRRDAAIKRLFDLVLSMFGLALTGGFILVGWLVATVDTGENGFFRQARIGRFGIPFKVVKLRTMKNVSSQESTVTVRGDSRITPIGSWLRRLKLDELPQLWNVLVGEMSFVGPRPDVAGFADRLTGEDRVILSIRPGITGPATLQFRDEEVLLASQTDPERYNRETLYPEKVRINRMYVEHYSFGKDVQYIVRTIFAADNKESK